MKTHSLFAAASLAMLFTVAAAEAPKGKDAVEEGMRQAFVDYKKGDNEAVTAKLRELIKILDERGANRVEIMMPDTVEDWKGETVKRDNAAALGGGVSLTRIYVKGGKNITVKVIKDSPLVAQLLPLLTNEELLRLANRKTYHIAGGTAVMDGEHKLQLVLDKRIYVELEGDETTGETDIAAFARKFDFGGLAKLK